MTAANGHRESPYFGLNYYREEDGDWFFGRNKDTDRVVTNLLASRLTLLHAETGVGKSSLLRAGVARRLRAAAFRAKTTEAPVYLPVVFNSWTDNPVQKLIEDMRAAAAVLGINGTPREASSDQLSEAIDEIVGESNTTLLLILDQFEEYLLYAPTEQPKPGHFADELARCVNHSSVPASFLISIREEAYAGLGDLLKGRIGNVYGNYLQIDHLDRVSAETAIREPLNVFNQRSASQITVDDDLVTAVLDKAPLEAAITGAGGAGLTKRSAVDSRVATPLLQLVMATVWETERSQGSASLRVETLRALERDGQTIVDTYLNDALDKLNAQQRSLAIDMLENMVTPDGAKVAASIAHLAVRVGKPERVVTQVLERLTERPVLRRVPPPPGQDPVHFQRYEIFHDVLAPAINREIALEAERRAIQRRQEQEEGKRRLRKWRRRAEQFRLLAVLSTVCFVAAAVFAVVAFRQREAAVRNLHVAQSLQLASYAQQTLSKDPKLSTLLALDALSIHDTPQAEAALQAGVGALGPVFHGDTAAVTTAVFSPDGRGILTASADGSVRLWSVSAPGAPVALSLGPAAVNSAHFSDDGRQIVVASASGRLTTGVASTQPLILSVKSRALIGAGGRPLNDAEFSPDGRLIVTAGADGTARVWNAANGGEVGAPLTAGAQAINSAEFSPDGQLIVTGGADGTARIWDASTHRQIGSPLLGGGGSINSAAFSPSGNTIVTAGTDGTARVWSVASHQQVRLPLISTGTVYSASYSPDGRLIVTTSADNTARIWAADSGRQLAILRGSFSDAMFNPAGTRIVTAGLDQKVRINGATVQILIGPVAVLERVARALVGHRPLTPNERETYLAGIGS